eukprot:CAMPEP_0178415992 /NCGR_PEP_ID=MMETSP0689_2-20121128/23833_1 /TAXON_ID=160604 /ORGANISM="Amphidinium massartii, Strain CS-259" /LENGTH=341 /DNA_ID=CAMNT_0020037321 /DNA_START=278 /DNA_END=1303 /DNA_ORIENTATION=-
MVFSWGFCAMHLYLRKALGFVKDTGETPTSWSLGKQAQKIAPLAFTFASSVACGNIALKYLFPSFVLMLGSFSPLITVCMAVGCMGKRYNKWTWISMPIICGGVGVCSRGERNFNLIGVAYMLFSVVMRGAKSLIQGHLLSDPKDKMDSPTLLYYMSPWAGLMMFFASLVMEGSYPIYIFFPTDEYGTLQHTKGAPKVLALLAFGGLNACMLNVCNFLVTSYTSAVSLQVLGNVKNCLGILISILVLGNDFTWIQAVGVAVSLFGVFIYNNLGSEIKPQPAAAPSPPPGKDIEKDEQEEASLLGKPQVVDPTSPGATPRSSPTSPSVRAEKADKDKSGGGI